TRISIRRAMVRRVPLPLSAPTVRPAPRAQLLEFTVDCAAGERRWRGSHQRRCGAELERCTVFSRAGSNSVNPLTKLTRTLPTLPLALSLLALPACDKKEEKKDDKKAEKKGDAKGDAKGDDKAAKAEPADAEEPDAEEPDAEEPE